MKFSTLVVTCLFVVGCKNPTKEFQALADRACECPERDAACGNKVLADVATFAENNKTDGNQEWITAGVRLTDCLSELGVKQGTVTAALEQISAR